MTGLKTKQNRRHFLQRSLLLSASFGFSPMLAAQTRQVERIGLQLYTLREELSRDFDGTLSRAAALGFREMEFAGYFERNAAEVRKVLDDNGLSSPAAHIQMAAVRSDLQREIDFAAEVGQRYIVVPIIADSERSADDYKRHAETLNHAGEMTRAAGIKMAYHNHGFEFERTGNRAHYDILLEETEPDLVDFELDLYWIANAGVDPMPYLASHPGRFSMLHVKDRDQFGRMTSVGSGTINFAEIFAQAETAGFQHFFIEHDNPGDGFASIASSIYTLRNLQF